MTEPKKPRMHDLIKTGDADSWKSIEDRNGEVVLSYCRLCKKGEGQLKPTCPGKRFTFEVEGSVTLNADSIWPDGDAPENPTLEDVAAVIAKHGGGISVMQDWNLDEDLTLTISDESGVKYIP